MGSAGNTEERDDRHDRDSELDLPALNSFGLGHEPEHDHHHPHHIKVEPHHAPRARQWLGISQR